MFFCTFLIAMHTVKRHPELSPLRHEETALTLGFTRTRPPIIRRRSQLGYRRRVTFRRSISSRPMGVAG